MTTTDCLDTWINHYRAEYELYRSSLANCLKRKIEQLCEEHGVKSFQVGGSGMVSATEKFNPASTTEICGLAWELYEVTPEAHSISYEHPGVWK